MSETREVKLRQVKWQGWPVCPTPEPSSSSPDHQHTSDLAGDKSHHVGFFLKMLEIQLILNQSKPRSRLSFTTGRNTEQEVVLNTVQYTTIVLTQLLCVPSVYKSTIKVYLNLPNEGILSLLKKSTQWS